MRRAVPARRNHNALIAEIRAALPIARYLEILHAAAVTGYLPEFSYDSATKEMKPTGQFSKLAPEDQINLLKYLADKILPAAPKEVDVTVAEVEAPTADRIKTMSTDELKRIVDAEFMKNASATAPDIG